MKRLTISATILCLVLIAVPATAQQKLGDVAGSIKLKKPEGDAVVIDDAQVGSQTRSTRGSSDEGLLYDILSDCLDASRSLAEMLNDAPRVRPMVYSEDWRDQLQESGLQLESVSAELQMLPDAGAYEDAYQKAVAGLEQVQQGYGSALLAASANQIINSEVRRQVSGGADTIEEAMTEARAVGRAEAAVAPAPAIDPIAAASSIQRVCSRMGAEGSDAYRSCERDQNAAVDALVARSAPSVGLDEATFNKIRNNCRYEWTDNYYNRNACETRRAAAAAGGP